MRKVKILAIAPYDGMAETIAALSAGRTDIEITICVGNLHVGLRVAQEHSYKNYDVILSRGGTADLIRAELDIPVIDAPLSAYDMLRSIKMAQNYSGKFAIAGFQSITSCAYMLCDLLQLDIDIFTFASAEHVSPILESIKAQSYQLVVCDMIGSIKAQELGLNAIMVPSGTESIAAALDDAVKLVRSYTYMTRQRDIFQNALTDDTQDVIIYDPKGNLWFSSLIEGSELRSPILNMAQTYLPAFTKMDGQSFERQIDQSIFTITSRHIHYDDEQYTLLRICKKNALFNSDDNSIAIYNKNEDNFKAFTTYYSSANHAGNVQQLIAEYAKSPFPILITGETGTGKDMTAAIIYENSLYQNAAYYMIDCAMVNDKKWHAIIHDERSPLHNIHTTIYIKNMDKLSDSQFADLQAFLEHSDLAKRNRLIFSLATAPGQSDTVRNYLANQLSCLLLPLPPLRERIEDIPSIATLYIVHLNASIGKQIVGFEPDAMNLMKSYSWPHNLDQLRRIIKELVTITKTSYITVEHVESLLKFEGTAARENTAVINPSGVDLNKTLDHITYDIIKIILNEENMNKEKTAKRLGISRSTLWRIIKMHEDL